MKLRYTCKDATAHILASQDQVLPWHARLLLSLHLRICAACPRLVAQMALLRRAMRGLRL